MNRNELKKEIVLKLRELSDKYSCSFNCEITIKKLRFKIVFYKTKGDFSNLKKSIKKSLRAVVIKGIFSNGGVGCVEKEIFDIILWAKTLYRPVIDFINFLEVFKFNEYSKPIIIGEDSESFLIKIKFFKRYNSGIGELTGYLLENGYRFDFDNYAFEIELNGKNKKEVINDFISSIKPIIKDFTIEY